MNDLIERLEAGDKEAIKEAAAIIRQADSICKIFLPVMEAARPLVLHLEMLKDYDKVRR